MVIERPATNRVKRTLQTGHVYLIGAGCLVCGLALGYGARQLRMPAAAAARPAAATAAAPFHHPNTGQRPSLGQLQQMANQQAAPMIEKLKSDPGNVGLLVQVGALYHATQQFQLAATYYGKAVAIDPKNVANHTRLAASLYRGGDADAAISQLNQALAIDPKDANSLFNLGLVKWEGKQDSAGALAAWKLLLKSNPKLAPERKATVQKMMNQAEAPSGMHVPVPATAAN